MYYNFSPNHLEIMELSLKSINSINATLRTADFSVLQEIAFGQENGIFYLRTTKNGKFLTIAEYNITEKTLSRNSLCYDGWRKIPTIKQLCKELKEELEWQNHLAKQEKELSEEIKKRAGGLLNNIMICGI